MFFQDVASHFHLARSYLPGLMCTLVSFQGIFFFICMLYSLWNGTSILSNNTHFIYDILCCTIDNFSNSLKWRILINYFSWRVIDIAWGLFPSSYFFIVQLLTRLIWNLLQSEYVEYKIVDMVVLLS